MKGQLFIVFTCLIVCNYTQNVTIKTPMGTVTGFRVDFGSDTSKLIYGKADIFLGIPFAEPPLGGLRFEKPQSLVSYPNGHVDATKYKPACTQPLDPLSDSCLAKSEDCLYLNVFTPNASTTDKYPVMVWIHGGGLQGGCGSQWTHLGGTRNLVSRGVVVVVIQYRLGVPGFFTTNTADFPPNRGLLDQLETLKWVQRNIASFGGDPNSVTIFGQSSGGASVNAHLYSPLSKGLFHRAIMESGALYLHTESQIALSTTGENIAKKLCNSSLTGNLTQLKSCMNALSPSEWLSVDEFDGAWPMTWDGEFLSKDSKISYFLPSGNYSFDDINKSLVKQFFESFNTPPLYGGDREAVWKVIENGYVPQGINANDSAAWLMIGTKILSTDSSGQYIAKEVHKQLIAGNSKVYLYELAYVSPSIYTPEDPDTVKKMNGYRPVPHNSELFYVWFLMADPQFDMIYDKKKITEFDLQLCDAYGTWWTNFAKFGHPTVDNSWKTMTLTSESEFLRIDSPGNGIVMVPGYLDRDFRVFQQQLRHYDEQPTDSKGKTTPFSQFTYFTILCLIYLGN